MRYTVPHYYSQFKCTASDCPDTCCAGWQIMIDKKSMNKYRKAKGAIGNRLHNSIDWKEEAFLQYDRRCAFLNEENLCDLYSEAGPGMLCRTCRNYPRHIEEFEGLREISLSLSCPEAARIILGCQEPVRFLTREKEGREEIYEDFNYFMFDRLMDTREVMFCILQNRSVSFPHRMSMLLAIGHDVQRCILSGEIFQIEEVLERYRRDGAYQKFGNKLSKYIDRQQSRFHLVREMFGSLFKLEILRPDWPAYMRDTYNILYREGEAAYEEKRNAFIREALETDIREVLEIRLEQIAVYFLFTYYCGAVYAGRAYGKVKFAAMSTVWIGEMLLAFYIREGRFPDINETAQIVWRLFREIEHSDFNLDVLDELFGRDSLFSLKNLFSVLSVQ